jgi:hypothetical protein
VAHAAAGQSDDPVVALGDVEQVGFLRRPLSAGTVMAPSNRARFEGLGRLEQVYRTPWDSSIGMLVAALVIAVTVSVLVWNTSRGEPGGVAVVMVGPVGVAVFLCWGVKNIIFRQTLLVFTEGIARIRLGRIHVFRWEDVSFHEGKTHEGRLTSPVVRDGAGAKLTCGDLKSEKVEQLRERMRGEVWRRALPRALDAYTAGGVVSFPPFGISRTELHFKGKTLEWFEVASVSLHHPGELRVWKKGSLLAWALVQESAIPNFAVFRELLERHLAITVFEPRTASA